MQWHLIILTLPTENTSTRMRAWRRLKAAGAAVLRDGVHLLPANAAGHEVLATIADDVEGAGGMAYVLDLAETHYPFENLFDRTDEFSRIATEIEALTENIAPELSSEQTRQARKLRKAFDAVAAIDFFPGEARRQTDALLSRLEHALKAAAASDEPVSHHGAVPPRAIADYQGRTWATRKRPWVDRLASAWLIRRRIDPAARFLWLDTPLDCPAAALGFDFDGAAFTHVGERVTFETLIASFGLESDPALMRLARVVHYLDVGGLPVAEASGLEALLAGMKAGIPDDDALLDAACASLDFFLIALAEQP